MMLVYNLPATDAVYQRFIGIDGSAYFVGGLGMTALIQQYRRRSNSLRYRVSSRRQCRIPEVYAIRDVEPVLTGERDCGGGWSALFAKRSGARRAREQGRSRHSRPGLG
jgi:hypothetical protein